MRFLSLSPLALFALTAAAQDPAPRQTWSDLDGDGLSDLYVVAPGRDDMGYATWATGASPTSPNWPG